MTMYRMSAGYHIQKVDVESVEPSYVVLNGQREHRHTEGWSYHETRQDAINFMYMLLVSRLNVVLSVVQEFERKFGLTESDRPDLLKALAESRDHKRW